MAYIISSGESSNGIILLRNTLTILDGGIATNITLNEDGFLRVSSGGAANCTMVNSGQLDLFSGGTANSTTVNFRGRLHVSNGATMKSTTVNSRGSMMVFKGGKVTGKMNFESGADVSMLGILDFDLACTSAGAFALVNDLSCVKGSPVYTLTVDNALNSEKGYYILADGASNFKSTITIVNEVGDELGNIAIGESLEISGIAYTLFLLDEELSLAIGCEPSVVFNDFLLTNESRTVGFGEVHSGATLSNGGILAVSSGGAAINTNVFSNGKLEVFDGGRAKNVQVDANGDIFIYSGGKTISAAVGPDGRFYVNVGGEVRSATISGNMYLSGGTADKVQVKDNGIVYVYNNGTASVVVNGGSLSAFSGGAIKYAEVYSSGNVYLAGGKANDTLISSGNMYVSNGGEAKSVTVMYGLLSVSGGLVNDASVYSYADMILYDGGTGNNTSVLFRGTIAVSSGGAANSATIMQGLMTVFSGGTAANTTVGTTDKYTSGGSMMIQGGTANNTTVNTQCRMWVSSGGTANNNTINSGGTVWVSSGGIANNNIVSGGNMRVFSGGTVNSSLLTRDKHTGDLSIDSGGMANRTTVNAGGRLFVSNGGTAKSTTVNSDGYLYVYSGGTATDILWTPCEGYVYVSDGGYATFVSQYSGVYYGSGNHLLSNATTMDLMTLGESEEINVMSGGTANNTTVNSGSYLRIFGGGKLTGKMLFEEGAVVSAEEGGTVGFDLAQAGETALVNDLSIIHGTPLYTLTVDDDLEPETYEYKLADGAESFTSTISVVNTSGNELGVLTVGETVKVGYDTYTLNLNEGALSVTVDVPDLTPTEPTGTADKVTWKATGAKEYIVEYSTDNFEHVIQVVTTGNAVDTPDLPSGTYQWRVKADANSDWAVGEAITVEQETDAAPKVVQSNEDGNDDLFFASSNGTWEGLYCARHTGSVNDWTGTKEVVSARGKGRIRNLFFGSADPNVLCLTDGENGDAIFVDDVYTELPETVAEHTARLYKIKEVRAGAGNDIVDMTSQRFEYVGDGLTIRGGAGNDTIWANKGDNWLFGDAGNDRIVGASGNDVIAGGIGNDRMHGGGGSDVFAFCENWGVDTVQQLETGSVTLWFVEGSIDNWNAETLTYADGENSIKVSGITAEQVTLKFGDDGSDEFGALSGMGAFDAFTSQRIFEESGTGMLASL